MLVIEFTIIINFLVAIGLGALIGLQREMGLQQQHQLDFGGFRTFILIALFGALTGYLATTVLKNTLFLIAMSFAFFLLAIVAYAVTAFRLNRVGATTEVSAIITFFLGILCTLGLVKLAVVFAVFVVIVLALKLSLHRFAQTFEQHELFATLKFALISVVILPFLPNVYYTPLDLPSLGEILLGLGFSGEILGRLDVFNPYDIWLRVVFITGVGFIGYMLIKIYGAGKGLGITGFFGGLISSTAVTFTLSAASKKNTRLHDILLSGILLASSTMFLRVLFIVLVFLPFLFKALLVPLGLMALTGFALAYLVFKRNHSQNYHFGFSSPFTLVPALKFSLFYLGVLILSQIGVILHGNYGIYGISLLSGMADLSAITLSVINLTKHLEIIPSVAVTGITLAVMMNTAVKSGIAYFFGTPAFGFKVIKAVGLIILAGVIGIFLV